MKLRIILFMCCNCLLNSKEKDNSKESNKKSIQHTIKKEKQVIMLQ